MDDGRRRRLPGRQGIEVVVTTLLEAAFDVAVLMALLVGVFVLSLIKRL